MIKAKAYFFEDMHDKENNETRLTAVDADFNFVPELNAIAERSL
jgi:hypothetical protein